LIVYPDHTGMILQRSHGAPGPPNYLGRISNYFAVKLPAPETGRGRRSPETEWGHGPGYLRRIFIFQSFLINILIITTPKNIFKSDPLGRSWHDQTTLSRQGMWRGNICHVGWRFRREKACRATPGGVTVLSYRATGSGMIRLNFKKS